VVAVEEECMSRLLGRGTYGITEAARFAQVNPGTARQWICGRGRAQKRLLKPDIPPVQDNYALSFLDLIDLLVVGRFREAGVSLQTLRKVYSRLRNTLGSAHPFSHHLLLTDGKTVFLETLDDIGDQRLEEVLSGQRAMPQVLLPYLRQVEYSQSSQIAERWNIFPGVVIDPDRSFGKPVITDAGTTTYVLARAFRANEKNAEIVADLFDVTVDAVEKAVAFEQEYGRRKAA
jgi:uncharacterized protein (DUF433 family)